jgi:hypothetical protein
VARADRIARREARRAARYVPPSPIPGLPMSGYSPPPSPASPYPGVFDPASGPGAAPGLGDSMMGFIYSSLFYNPQPAPTVAAPNNGANMGSLFDGGASAVSGSGGFDWGGLIGSIGQGAIGIMQQKAQNKMLKRLMRLRSGGNIPMGTFAGGGVTPTGALYSNFSGVPAVSTGGFAGGAAAGALGGLAMGLLPELGDMLPGGLEESGTGLFGPDLFKAGAASQRQRMIDAVHPTSGERVYWRPVGRPIMFTGDAALLKRTRKMVRKMSSTAGCGFGGRSFRRRRR